MSETNNSTKIYIPQAVRKADFDNLVTDVRALEGKIVYCDDPNGPENPVEGMIWLYPAE